MKRKLYIVLALVGVLCLREPTIHRCRTQRFSRQECFYSSHHSMGPGAAIHKPRRTTSRA